MNGELRAFEAPGETQSRSYQVPLQRRAVRPLGIQPHWTRDFDLQLMFCYGECSGIGHELLTLP